MSPDQILIIIAIVTPVWALSRILRGSLGEALARRIGGTAQTRAAPDAELGELRARLAELEERVDFTERVLLQERQTGQLREGDSR